MATFYEYSEERIEVPKAVLITLIREASGLPVGAEVELYYRFGSLSHAVVKCSTMGLDSIVTYRGYSIAKEEIVDLLRVKLGLSAEYILKQGTLLGDKKVFYMSKVTTPPPYKKKSTFLEKLKFW